MSRIDDAEWGASEWGDNPPVLPTWVLLTQPAMAEWGDGVALPDPWTPIEPGTTLWSQI